jgi:nitrogen fixation/metabolism regulation signal transduction histidine kinase
VNRQGTAVIENGHKVHYQYTFMPRESDFYENSVLRIKSDRGGLTWLDEMEVMIYAGVSLLLVIVLMIILLLVSRSITFPLIHLKKSLDDVADGGLDMPE